MSTSAGFLDDPLDEGCGLLRVLSKPPAEFFLNGLSDAGAYCGVSQPTARGALEFGALQLHVLRVFEDTPETPKSSACLDGRGTQR